MANDPSTSAPPAGRLPLAVLLITAVAGGLIGAILAFAIASAGRWPLPASDPALADLTFRVEGVEAATPQIEAAYNSALNNARTTSVLQSELETTDALLRTDLDALKDQTLRAFSNAYYAQQRAVGRLGERLDTLAAAPPATDPALTADIASLRATLATLQAAPPPPTDPAVVDEIAAVRAALRTLQSAPPTAADPAVTAELAALRDALAEIGAAQTALAVRLKTLETTPSGAAIPSFAPVDTTPLAP